MGKNRHSKDKLYIVASEYSRDWGGYTKKSSNQPFSILSFDCCNISLLPFKNPVCTEDGAIFDKDNIIAHIEKHSNHPITKSPLKVEDLIELHFYRNENNKFHCPVTLKEFNNHSHIVANKKTGNVYSYDAINTICRRNNFWYDLLTHEPFVSSDIITLRDSRIKNVVSQPTVESSQKENILEKTTKNDVAQSLDGADLKKSIPSIKTNYLSEKIINESKANTEAIVDQHNKIIPNINLDLNSVSNNKNIPASTVTIDNVVKKEEDEKHTLYTTSKVSASFTSTCSLPSYTQEFRSVTEDEKRTELYKAIRKSKKKGYVRLVTTLGDINIELHCDKIPELCHNFIRHCASKYYENTVFHRSIKNFMIQGGDPTGTGRGGKSSFEDKEVLRDEFHPHLVHKGGGIVSMANSGKNTNRSQFFITYKSCEHLNNLHSVIGRVVGGISTLNKMEELKTDDKDRPLVPPLITEVIVFKDPFSELMQEKEKEKEKKNNTNTFDQLTTREILDPMRNHPKRASSEIGKYVNFELISNGGINTKDHAKVSNKTCTANNCNVSLSKNTVLAETIQRKLKKKKIESLYE